MISTGPNPHDRSGPGRGDSTSDTAPGCSAYPTAARWGLALSLLFVLYETTLPFRFDFGLAQLAAGWKQAVIVPFTNPPGASAGRADVVGNVPLFVPLGFFLTLAGVWRSTGAWRPLLLTLTGLAVSLTVETFQLFSPVRYCQTTDLITNSLGTALGVITAWTVGRDLFDRACSWTVQKLRNDPTALALAAMTVIILLGALLPFDFSISRRSLTYHLQRASLGPVWSGAPDTAVAALALIKQAWLFAFWGGVAAYRLVPGTWARVLGLAVILAVAAEGSHLFVKSRSLAALPVLASVLGAAAGAGFCRWGQRLGWSGRQLLIGAGVGYAIYLLADCLSPLAATLAQALLRSAGSTPPPPSGPIPLLPTEPLPTLMALGEGAARLARFVPLGGILRLATRPGPARAAATVATAGGVLALELLVWRVSPGAGNLSEVILAWVGIWAGWLLASRVAELLGPGSKPGKPTADKESAG
jgi:glycopeptide antibiotics resistance protein